MEIELSFSKHRRKKRWEKDVLQGVINDKEYLPESLLTLAVTLLGTDGLMTHYVSTRQ